MLKRNVIANFLGQGWTALMGLAFVPLYIKYLGIEAYGLIGVFALLQVWLNLLDMGMTPALSREMARFKGGAHNAQSIRDLLRSIELIGVCVALLVAVAIWLASDWLAADWLNVKEMPIHSVAQACVIMGIVAALRFIENIYRSSIVGLEKQVLLNVVTVVMATLRGLGAVVVLIWISPSINAFFIWQGIISALSVVILIPVLYKALPASQTGGRFSWAAVTKIWRYAAGIMLITLLSFLLMQTDKILLSRLLTLEHFGYYTIAALVANSLQMLAGPIDMAFFPRFTEQASRNDQSSLISTFHVGAQLITVLVGATAIELIVFGDILLQLWTQDAVLAKTIAPLLTILSLGTLFNVLMHMPYQLQLAHGWTRLTIYVNTIAVLLLVPAIFLVAPRYGAVGVAWIWVLLNAGYVLFAVQIMFRRLLITEKLQWYKNDIAKPLLAAIVMALFVRWIAPINLGMLGQFLVLLFSLIFILITAAFTAPLVNQHIKHYVGKTLKLYFVGKF